MMLLEKSFNPIPGASIPTIEEIYKKESDQKKTAVLQKELPGCKHIRNFMKSDQKKHGPNHDDSKKDMNEVNPISWTK